MPRPCSIHCVMPSGRRRAPGLAHRPAFRLAAGATALAIAGTMLALAPPRASAATRPSLVSRPLPDAGPPSPARRLLSPAPASRPEVGLQAARKRTVPPRDVLPDLPNSQRLDQQFAEYALRASGIGWRSTGGCSDRTVRTCTSFEGIRWGTIRSLIEFAESSGCEVTVTGGTEHGHAGGVHSHANGYKVDIATGICVDEAVRRYPFTGVRGDGARLHRSPEGVVFAREKDHWDITIRRGPRG